MAFNIGFKPQNPSQNKKINPALFSSGFKIDPSGKVVPTAQTGRVTFSNTPIATLTTMPTTSPPTMPPPQGGASSPTPAPPSVAPSNILPTQGSENTKPQIDAILASLGNIAGGLSTLKSNVTSATNPSPDPYATIEKSLLESLVPTSEESELSSQLANLRASKELGVAAIREKPIPLPFITGQEAALERSFAAKSGALTTQLANIQAKRQAALDVAKTKLELQKAKAEREKPIEVGGALIRVNPQTGKYEPVYESTKEAKAPTTIETAQGIMQWDPSTKSWKATGFTKPQSESSIGKKTEKEEARRAAMLRSSEISSTAIKFIDSALANEEAINTNPVGRKIQALNPYSNEYTLARDIDTVKSLIGFDALEQMRKASPTGGALGQVSERELAFLQATRGSLDLGLRSDVLKRNLESIRQSFLKVQRLIQAEAGVPVRVRVTNPQGETIVVDVGKEDLENLLLEGNNVEFL